MTLCVIPARGGSRRIPGKNMRRFAGRPMIAWSIAAAQAAGCFTRIVVSTDDDDIASVAAEAGAEVPFRRPDALANDHATTADVMSHAVTALRAEGAVCCIYATAPFAQAEDIRAGLAALPGADYALPVTSFPFPIQRAVRIDVRGRLGMLQPEHAATRSQDLEEAFHDAGQFYWGAAEAWREMRPIFGQGTVALRIPRWRVQDIDTEEDWARAEAMFAAITR